MKLSRREFLIVSTLVGIELIIGKYYPNWLLKRKNLSLDENEKKELINSQIDNSDVFVIKTDDRGDGLKKLLERFDLSSYYGKRVAMKANYNSAHPYPASTHVETVKALIQSLKEAGAVDITLAERSGMGSTNDVLKQRGVIELADKMEFNVVSLDHESKERWAKIEASGLHWENGFYISKIFLEADKIVQTCCLKTHRFGGHFTMSLKNSVGLVAKKVPGNLHDYMRELHGSSNQRLMIAEVNRFYNADLNVMDAIEAFVNKGPEVGDVVYPNLLLASRDRVALDAVGIAILRSFGSTEEVMKGKIFELDQISRAAELGVGVSSADGINVIPLNEEAIEDAEKLSRIVKS
jgi:uncharacterized protein (DUF362 family)